MNRREVLAAGTAMMMAGGFSRLGHAAKPIHILILGGTGFLGPKTIDAALARGHRVTLFNRGKTRPNLYPDLEKLRGDRDGQLEALQGRRFDAVIDTSGYVPRHVKLSVELLAPGVSYYQFISTISVYARNDEANADESAALGTLDDPGTEEVTGLSYGPLKALCEQAAEAAMPGRVSVVRPGLIVGPGDPTDRFSYWPVRADRGGEMVCPNSPEDPTQVIDVRDLAVWMVHCCEARVTGIYNATSEPGRFTMGEVIEASVAAASNKATPVWLPTTFLEEQEVAPWQHMPAWLPASGEYAAFADRNVSRALTAGLKIRDLPGTVTDILTWFKSLPEQRQQDLRAGLSPEQETAVLEAWYDDLV